MTAASDENLAEWHPTVAPAGPPLPELSLERNCYKVTMIVITLTSRNQCLKESQPNVSTTSFLVLKSPVVWTMVA